VNILAFKKAFFYVQTRTVLAFKDRCGLPNPFSVHSEVVDFGSGQGRSALETAGVAQPQRYVEDFKGVRTPAWAERCHFWMNTIDAGGILWRYPAPA